MTRGLDVSFMTCDSKGNLHPTTPQAAIVAAQTYLMTTKPEYGPRAHVHKTLIAGLNAFGQHLEGSPLRHESPRQEVVPPGQNNTARQEVAPPNNPSLQEVAPPGRHNSSRQDVEPRQSRSLSQPRATARNHGDASNDITQSRIDGARAERGVDVEMMKMITMMTMKMKTRKS
jgi:hypothetical protein